MVQDEDPVSLCVRGEVLCHGGERNGERRLGRKSRERRERQKKAGETRRKRELWVCCVFDRERQGERRKERQRNRKILEEGNRETERDKKTEGGRQER
jgi:hypothetical protein